MDLNSEIVMAESSVISSTELNVHSDTVDPSVLALNEPSSKPMSSIPGFALDVSPPPVAALGRTFDPQQDISDDDDDATSSSGAQMDPEYDVTLPNPRPHVQVVIPVPKPKFQPLPVSSTQSGLVYSNLMRFHTETVNTAQDEDDIHPEDPRRIWVIYEELVKAGLVDDPRVQGPGVDFKLWWIQFESATPADIALVHKPEYWNWVAQLEGRAVYEPAIRY